MKRLLNFFFFICIINFIDCYIKPLETTTRQIKLLDGIWNFKLDPKIGLVTTRKQHVPLDDFSDSILMPVPSSFNDITQNSTIRDYVGWVWYEKSFILHENFLEEKKKDLFIHFGSVNYHCEVYLNDNFLGQHSSGHLPFEFLLPSDYIKANSLNSIKVAVNNILTLNTTIPQANTFKPKNSTEFVYPKDFMITQSGFDFYNYAGIHRSVSLYTKPKIHIEKVEFNFINDNETVVFNYSVSLSSELSDHVVKVTLFDKEGNIALETKGDKGKDIVDDPKYWWPLSMNKNPGYLYNLNIQLLNVIDLGLIDEINIKAGIRFIKFVDNILFINNKRAYLTGFGKHEDMDIKGRGLDLALLIKDFNLIKWMNANSFRTSHYPYSEELMDLADEYGVLIIDECPAVSLNKFTRELLEVHKFQLKSLIDRDRNHPSVIFWSVANEAESDRAEADEYFKNVTEYVRSLDNTRPVTAAINKRVGNCNLSKYLDVIMLNRYIAWYGNADKLQLIKEQIKREFDVFYQKYNKSMMISEYGADTVAGLHQSPSKQFSEDYQSEYLKNHFDGFNDLIQQNYFIGEHYWNFADFMTKADYTRVLGNRKGLFTRDRQPKAAARVMRCRYFKLAAFFANKPFKPDHQMYC